MLVVMGSFLATQRTTALSEGSVSSPLWKRIFSRIVERSRRYGLMILFHKGEETEPSDNAVVRWVARKLPMTTSIEGSHFFVKHDGRRFGTPLLLALVAAETTDLVFALDSIPAVFA